MGIDENQARIVDIAAIHVCNISVALASNDTVYVWGQVCIITYLKKLLLNKY